MSDLYRIRGIGAMYSYSHKDSQEAWNVGSAQNPTLREDLASASISEFIEIRSAFHQGFLKGKSDQIRDCDIVIRVFDPAGQEVATYYRSLRPNHFLNKLLCVMNCAIDAQRTASRAVYPFRARIKVEVK